MGRGKAKVKALKRKPDPELANALGWLPILALTAVVTVFCLFVSIGHVKVEVPTAPEPGVEAPQTPFDQKPVKKHRHVERDTAIARHLNQEVLDCILAGGNVCTPGP